MKKILTGIAILGMLSLFAGCEPDIDDPTPTPTDTKTTDSDTTKTFTEGLSIVWNGREATVSGEVKGVAVTSNESGYVVITSTVKAVKYSLSGNGNGQFKLYSDYKYELQLNDLTLTCADGPAINSQCKKAGYIVVNGTNSLSDGSSYADSGDEDQKAALFSEGQLIIFGTGSLAVTGNYKHALASDDYIQITAGTIAMKANVSDGLHTNDGITIDGGFVCAHSSGNDGMDANGKCYIKGGTVYAIGSSAPEVGIDANSEERKKLYVSEGTLVAIGGLESGSSLTQKCYSTSSWSKNTWYALYKNGEPVLAFKTPASGGSTLVVSTSSTTTLKSGVTATGTSIFNNTAYTNPEVSGGSNVTLTSYK